MFTHNIIMEVADGLIRRFAAASTAGNVEDASSACNDAAASVAAIYSNTDALFKQGKSPSKQLC